MASAPVRTFRETPPRTWRRPLKKKYKSYDIRNTSTDVEKTYQERYAEYRYQKHLHGRGEDRRCSIYDDALRETPPRTWRRPALMLLRIMVFGNTSTDVEKTHSVSSHHGTIRKHLHGRGEDSKPLQVNVPVMETPPRTWRRLQDLALG